MIKKIEQKNENNDEEQFIGPKKLVEYMNNYADKMKAFRLNRL
jgi:hypothetical protein